MFKSKKFLVTASAVIVLGLISAYQNCGPSGSESTLNSCSPQNYKCMGVEVRCLPADQPCLRYSIKSWDFTFKTTGKLRFQVKHDPVGEGASEATSPQFAGTCQKDTGTLANCGPGTGRAFIRLLDQSRSIEIAFPVEPILEYEHIF